MSLYSKRGVSAQKEEVHKATANKNKDIIDQLKKFTNVTMFKYLNSGSYANVYQINNNQVVRISLSLPPPTPKDPYINQREGFLKVGEYYFEFFPLLQNIGNISLGEIRPIIKYLEEKYQAFDLHKGNFGRDPKTGKIKLLDPGSLPGIKIEDEDLELISSNRQYYLSKKSIKNILYSQIDTPFEYRIFLNNAIKICHFLKASPDKSDSSLEKYNQTKSILFRWDILTNDKPISITYKLEKEKILLQIPQLHSSINLPLEANPVRYLQEIVDNISIFTYAKSYLKLKCLL